MRNPYLCLVIVCFIGGAGILGMLGIIACSLWGHEVPQAVVAVVSGAFGSLASFLVQPPRSSMGLGNGGEATTTTVIKQGS